MARRWDKRRAPWFKYATKGRLQRERRLKDAEAGAHMENQGHVLDLEAMLEGNPALVEVIDGMFLKDSSEFSGNPKDDVQTTLF